MYAIDFISEFSVNRIPEPDTTLEALLRQTEEHDTTLTSDNLSTRPGQPD